MADPPHVDERLMRGDRIRKLVVDRDIPFAIDLARFAQTLLQWMEHAESDAVLLEGRLRLAFHFEGERPRRPGYRAAPFEVDAALLAGHLEHDLERVRLGLDDDVRHPWRDGPPHLVSNRYIDPVEDFDPVPSNVPNESNFRVEEKLQSRALNEDRLGTRPDNRLAL